MNEEKLKVIASFGRRYQKDHLYKERDKNTLQQLLISDWWEALKFFFERSFMRGRRDEISITFMRRASRILKDFLGSDKDKTLKILSNNEWKDNLQFKLQKGMVNNQGDRRMIVSTLELISKLQDTGFNLVTYSTKEIREKKIEELYEKLDELDYVGDKITSFFLRDVVCIFDLQLDNEQQVFLQPVDTWVGKVIKDLNIYRESDIDKAIGNKKLLHIVRKSIVESCNNIGVSPIEFNQGAWYIGFHSFQILLENLLRIRQE
ncbi:MAG: hypothetical protein ACE5HR_02980 [bacterium]